MGVDVDSGAFCLTPTELEVVPRIRIENASDSYFSLQCLPNCADDEEKFATFVVDVDTLTPPSTFAGTGDYGKTIDWERVNV